VDRRASHLLPEVVNVVRPGTLSAQALLLLMVLCFTSAAEVHTLTDAAGREVVVPKQIERVYAAGPPPVCWCTQWLPTSCSAGRGR
jgi:hypothetical protein